MMYGSALHLKNHYNPEACHFNWRGLWDYGTGAMGDMGAHIFDAPIWALNLGMPTKIQASTSPYSTDFMPLCESVTYQFPGTWVICLLSKYHGATAA